ncbi:ATP-binding cassette domain-containing protein [Insolitispirillum peregrinum]|uniref:NitT/TauT family transport system ATP-binding protein n=1 Tax=Insolitispirillum peregrinum TaxID=80876 RepID=A0A1N7MMA0_9PROT|nr:ATP-binding cassette domain-containing protein [Insolitispirillum peregrinum]SIS87217.1 NitT/TauT family transport system ATP-binding protein [Insolitispirillum peregrinum]
MCGGGVDLTIERKQFGDRLILQRFALCVRAGEAVALTGPSGRGKSTVLRIVAGLDRDFHGQRQLDQAVRVTMVFQEPRLLPWRTARQSLLLCQPPGGAEAVAAMLQAVGLAGAEDLYPAQMSLGMQRRAALARALVMQPDLLILDEAFASLDQTTAEAMRALLRSERQRRPFTLLMATHSPDDLALVDRVVAL